MAQQVKWWEGDKQKRVLAPMVGICFSSYRTMCLEHGADAVFTEELISKRLCQCIRVEEDGYVKYKDKDDVMLTLKVSERDKTILQLGTYDVATTVKSVELVKEVCGVDINLGCGMSFSTKGGMGQALVSDRSKLESIIKALVPLGQPISCKIRLQNTSEETVSFIQWLYSLGVCMITLHGRKHGQLYDFDCDWDELIKVSNTITSPLFINGDLCCQSDFDKFAPDKTKNVKGFLLGRGAAANIDIFQQDQRCDYKFDFEKTQLTLLDFINRATLEKLSFKKTKFVAMQIVKYNMEMPSGRWRKQKTPKELVALNASLSKSKSFDELLRVFAFQNNKKTSN
ncbi:tRNA-dihydrouridine synthase, putative [Entamoeba invadens IP1]|uniref:tRNA-dihydrouridine synthase, putative n=1 Tax=Entamoeba invadens IP1 TaxID=370355 RepID=UPI0002C3E4EF|nr:tRNA-dihydrouridine synthase, putative [Entamoeba invadens IP1]ELP85117.1 tRNA-dihydrouridine synthase, putative [Entamoeba invadens IP1]|eukprot:XP_004184463.1 tRNA-dihydrouridine synthase, putative [Entamoeba invadens IP1]